jgi:hypothetical protein
MSTKQRQRWSRRRGRDDDGQALIIVLILALALITMVTFAVSSSVANLNSSANYANSSQAQLTAYSGLSNATSAMAGNTIAALPCPTNANPITGTMPLPRTAGGNSTYSVTIAYFSDKAATVPLACNGSGNTFGTGGVPASAILTSTGTSPTTPVVMRETVSIAATAQLLPAFYFALFSPSSIKMIQPVVVKQMTSGPPEPGIVYPEPGSVYGGAFSQVQSVVIQGNFTSYSDLTFTNSANISENLYVQGDVRFKKDASIGGNVYAIGGSVKFDSTATIGGSIYAIAKGGVGGTIDTGNNVVTVGGNLDATGSITTSSSTTVTGSINQNDTDPAFTALVMPAQVSLPQLNPTVASLQAAGYNVIQVPSLAFPLCSSLFSAAGFYTFLTGLLSSTNTAIYAPTCTLDLQISPWVPVNTNMLWVIGGIRAIHPVTFTAIGLPSLFGLPSPATWDLSIIVPFGTSCSPSGDLSFIQPVTVDPQINFLFYTPCNVGFVQMVGTMNGQILAGQGISFVQGINLNFDNLAGFMVPGASFPSAAISTVQSKTVSSG